MSARPAWAPAPTAHDVHHALFAAMTAQGLSLTGLALRAGVTPIATARCLRATSPRLATLDAVLEVVGLRLCVERIEG